MGTGLLGSPAFAEHEYWQFAGMSADMNTATFRVVQGGQGFFQIRNRLNGDSSDPFAKVDGPYTEYLFEFQDELWDDGFYAQQVIPFITLVTKEPGKPVFWSLAAKSNTKFVSATNQWHSTLGGLKGRILFPVEKFRLMGQMIENLLEMVHKEELAPGFRLQADLTLAHFFDQLIEAQYPFVLALQAKEARRVLNDQEVKGHEEFLKKPKK